MRLVLLALSLMGATLASAQDRPNLLANGGFEGDPQTLVAKPGAQAQVSGTIATGWLDNSEWAHVTAQYELRHDTPHGGNSYQRIIAKEILDGRVQMWTQPPTLEADKVYECEAWVRSPDHTGVTLIVRQPPAPYRSYAEAHADCGPQWQRLHCRVPSPGKLPVSVMILLDGPGTVDVDDVVFRLAGEVSDAAPQTGNLAPLGRLGAGLPGGWHSDIQNVDWQADAQDGPCGPGAAKLVIGDHGRFIIQTPARFLRFGVKHSAGLWVKAEPAGARVSLDVRSNDDDGRGFGRGISATTQWQHLVASGKAPLTRDERSFVMVSVTGSNATVWLDGLSLREGDDASPDATLPAGVSVTPTQPWGVYTGNESLAVKLRVVGAPPGAKLVSVLRHVDGRVADDRNDMPTIALDGKTGSDLPMSFGGAVAASFGLMRLEATVVDAAGKPLSPMAETLLARVPTPPAGDRPNSYFGTHVELREPDVTAVAKLGFKWCRLHDASILTKWALAEPQPGQWKFYDDEMALARRHGISILGMLCSSPPWASGHPGERGYFSMYYPPKDIEQWRTYVRTVVGHYKGVVDTWEVWNEPWGTGMTEGFLRGGSPQIYAPLLKAAYEEAKKANPNCTIVGIDTYPASWDEGVLAEGTFGSFDIESFHRYESTMPGGPGDCFAVETKRLRAVQAKYGTPKPLWDTEGGPGTTSKGSFFSFAQPDIDGDWDRFADQVPRYWLGALAAGVIRFNLYTLHASSRFGQPNNWALTEPGWLCKPLIVSTSVLISFVDGAKWKERLTPAKGVSVHWFDHPEASVHEAGAHVVAVLISDNETSVDLPKAIPAGVRCFDRWGNACPAPVKAGRAPVYLVATGAAVEALRGALMP